MELILASQSPQRKKILEKMELKFKVIPAHIDEHHSGFKKPHAVAKSIALRKAMKVSGKNPKDWVIGCDTIVVLSDGRIAGKPEDRNDAEKTLKSYRNSYCNVYSGLSLVNSSLNKIYNGYERTKIIFEDISDTQIEAFLDTGEWRGRSGSITIEGKDSWVRTIRGEYWNIVGMPIDLLKSMLKKADLI